MNLDMPKMVFDPPLPRGVYQQMADDEKYETLKEISESAKKIAESAVADAQKSKKTSKYSNYNFRSFLAGFFPHQRR